MINCFQTLVSISTCGATAWCWRRTPRRRAATSPAPPTASRQRRPHVARHAIDTHLNPRCLIEMASFDEASNNWQALVEGSSQFVPSGGGGDVGGGGAHLHARVRHGGGARPTAALAGRRGAEPALVRPHTSCSPCQRHPPRFRLSSLDVAPHFRLVILDVARII